MMRAGFIIMMIGAVILGCNIATGGTTSGVLIGSVLATSGIWMRIIARSRQDNKTGRV